MRRPALQRRALSIVHPVYKRLETSVHPLRYLFLEITSRCNLSCRHCGSDCGKSALPNELSTERWVELLDDLPRMFPRKAPFLVLTGGEPLCHPRLPILLETIQKNGLRFGMVTNGWLLDEERLGALLGFGMQSMTVSLDGTREAHDWLRGRVGSFDRAVRAVSLLAKSSIPIFDVVTCVNPGNLNELPAIEKVLLEAGVSRWRLFSIFPKGRAKNDPSLILNPAQIKQLLAWIAARRRAHGEGGFAVDFCCEGYLPRDVDRQVRDEPYFCRAGINVASVLADGTISACPNIAKSLAQGNIDKDDLRHVWEEGFRAYRDRSWMRTGPCVSCGEWKRCQGNSMHLWDDERHHTVLCHHMACLEGRDAVPRRN